MAARITQRRQERDATRDNGEDGDSLLAGISSSPLDGVVGRGRESRTRPLVSSDRQTEGQRAAAQRLREWQGRRRRGERGGAEGVGGGEVRGVRNYNVRED